MDLNGVMRIKKPISKYYNNLYNHKHSTDACVILEITKYRNGEQISGTGLERKALNMFCERVTEKSIVGME